jgi:YD repeat-containing protein
VLVRKTVNNGRITQMKDWLSGEEVTYSHDSLNRLIQAVTTGPECGLTFSYDGFGNMTSQHVFKGLVTPTDVKVASVTGISFSPIVFDGVLHDLPHGVTM